MCHVLRCGASSLGVAIKMVALLLLSVVAYFVGYLYGIYREYESIKATASSASGDAVSDDVVSFAEAAADRAWYYAYHQYSGDGSAQYDDGDVHQWGFIFWSVYVAAVLVYGLVSCFCTWQRCASATDSCAGTDAERPLRRVQTASDDDYDDDDDGDLDAYFRSRARRSGRLRQ